MESFGSKCGRCFSLNDLWIHPHKSLWQATFSTIRRLPNKKQARESEKKNTNDFLHLLDTIVIVIELLLYVFGTFFPFP